jgi:hypothetical protein
VAERNDIPYHAYLVRCWRDPDNPLDPWRFSLEEVGVDDSRQGFLSLGDLFGCLTVALDPEADKDDCRPV